MRYATQLAWCGVACVISGCAGDLVDEPAWRENVPLSVGAREPNSGRGARRRSNGGGLDGPQQPREPLDGGTPGEDGGGAASPRTNPPSPGTTPPPTSPPAGTEAPPTEMPRRCAAVELEGCPDVPTQIFAVSCGTQNCHGSAGKPPLGFTDLGNSVNDITERLIDLRGTPGEECASYKVLNSKNPEQSLLFLKLDPNPPCGSHMPWGYNELSDNDRDCIRRWGMAVLAGHTVDGPCYKEP